MGTDPTTAPDTIVVIHGFRLTARSGEKWVDYGERGGKVVAPNYSGLEVEWRRHHSVVDDASAWSAIQEAAVTSPGES